ncbi:glucan biosynthesis protein [Marinobacter sp. M216]|uniref:Glucan biosynthesis protein n=1 Tax=Marinobacter albus TaxID=3030833 RepID=A0ABT7HCA8_9GAMM|nr:MULTISPECIES: glucan biosynthesis protein [unclassified Marinobacter]MBW7470084.1 glucan biosynthesis protein [Marinobacter sp. F4218]MDK9557652.1 glucan biosynthesis protein [Marinobacter sp. M216]
MDRRSLLRWVAVGAGSYYFPSGWLWAAESESPSEGPKTFSYEWLKGRARYLSEQSYESHEGELPDSLKALSWDDYQAISFRPDRALWAGQSLPFRVQLFHLGLYFQTPVRIHEVQEGMAWPLEYHPDYFKYEGEQPLGKLPRDLGFAGFRIHYHTNFELDLAAFLGASYFRAVGKEIQYGMSARGLAINTAGPDGEEFPRFAEYWLERPAPGAKALRVWALLDSPSVTGAYAFVLDPGARFVMDVEVALYPRKEIDRLGIAPLTSMYQVGENSRRMDYDWRPEIHDSDGLLMHTGADQWIWRPIVNPGSLRYNSFLDQHPKGFGLLQRDRDFDHYQDDGVFYDRRPGLWVEPLDGWGAGSVDLVEIPTVDETFDNIVAYWNPETVLSPGQEYLFSYRLTWGDTAPLGEARLATTRATRTGLGGVVGQPREYFSWRFVIDFAGGMLEMLSGDAQVEPVITVSRGSVEISSARPLASLNGYRAMFDLVPDNSTDPIDLTVVLKLGDEVLTETWVYQYSPPPPKERELY